MSRLGKLPIELGENTQAKIENGFIIVKGPKGELKQELNKMVSVKIEDKSIVVSIEDKTNNKQKAFWGLYRSLINNMVIGVEEGFEKKLEINGVGYKLVVQGKILMIHVGYSNPVEFAIPEGITITVEGNVASVMGVSKQLVGETAAQIRKVRKPEPYKGKGIKYTYEVIIRKEGKSAAKSE